MSVNDSHKCATLKTDDAAEKGGIFSQRWAQKVAHACCESRRLVSPTDMGVEVPNDQFSTARLFSIADCAAPQSFPSPSAQSLIALTCLPTRPSSVDCHSNLCCDGDIWPNGTFFASTDN